jgi:hypothetical protein
VWATSIPFSLRLGIKISFTLTRFFSMKIL